MTGLEGRVDEGQTLTKRLTIPAAEEILGKTYDVLDHGFVRLVDYMGGDDAVVQAARTSYGRGTTKSSEDGGLIRYLMRHKHSTPFEMVELKFHAKMPIFVARQWVRHRTASINEISARYSILDKEFYVPNPQDFGTQAKNNKQGRAEAVNPEQAGDILRLIKESALRDYDFYEDMHNVDSKDLTGKTPKDPSKPMVARELARIVLPVNFYTQWYWKANMHNVFHFLGLRMDPHAQKEIRVYADKMAEMVKAVAPISHQAFEDYSLGALSLSRLDQQALSLMLVRGITPQQAAAEVFRNRREETEFVDKYLRIREAHEKSKN